MKEYQTTTETNTRENMKDEKLNCTATKNDSRAIFFEIRDLAYKKLRKIIFQIFEDLGFVELKGQLSALKRVVSNVIGEFQRENPRLIKDFHSHDRLWTKEPRMYKGSRVACQADICELINVPNTEFSM